MAGRMAAAKELACEGSNWTSHGGMCCSRMRVVPLPTVATCNCTKKAPINSKYGIAETWQDCSARTSGCPAKVQHSRKTVAASGEVMVTQEKVCSCKTCCNLFLCVQLAERG